MREWIKFYYRDAIKTAPIIEEGSNYYIVEFVQPEQLVVPKDHVISKYETYV